MNENLKTSLATAAVAELLGHKAAGTNVSFPAGLINEYVPLVHRREFTPAEETEVAAGESQFIPQLITTDSTRIPKLLSSPRKGGLAAGIAGGGLGAAAGGAIGYGAGGVPGAVIGGVAGGALGGGIAGVRQYLKRLRHNEYTKEMMRRLPEGATKRDLDLEILIGGALKNNFEKMGAKAESVAALSGRLQLSSSGWLLLNVPNAIVNGLFQAINEHGVEMPPARAANGVYQAHISVMHRTEVEAAGGGDKITERGKLIPYQLGQVKTCNPDGWPEMEQVWFVEVESPALEAIRKKYGLTGLPKKGKHKFHITFAVRRREKGANKVASLAPAYATGLRNALLRASQLSSTGMN
jgi:hypothetical protein